VVPNTATAPAVEIKENKERVYGSFFMKTTITGIVYLYMLAQLENDQEGRIHFQQDGAPPVYHGEMREYFNTRFPGQWTGRTALIAWSPHSPELTPLDFFLRAFVKDRVLISPLPANVIEL
jgi:hypothetical protein